MAGKFFTEKVYLKMLISNENIPAVIMMPNIAESHRYKNIRSTFYKQPLSNDKEITMICDLFITIIIEIDVPQQSNTRILAEFRLRATKWRRGVNGRENEMASRELKFS